MNGGESAKWRELAWLTAGVLPLSAAVSIALAPTASAGTKAPGGEIPGTRVSGTPCTTSARACVDLDDQKAWLITGGKVTLGPIRISSGGQGKETPGGVFRVLWKDKDHASREFPLPDGRPAPMPWSVFFETGGIAFHGGDPKRASAGCIHVPIRQAETFFETLAVGDEVQVTASLDKVKGGFYGVNHLDPPHPVDKIGKPDKRAPDKKTAARKKRDD